MTRHHFRDAAALTRAMAAYDAAVGSWPLPVEGRDVETRVGPAHVLSFGDPADPPLVLLHGSGSNSTSWAGDAATYASAFRCHAIDLPGESGRSTQVRPPYAGSTYADWLADILGALHLPRVSLTGLSLGGWVALKFAAAHPESVERIAVISPGGIAPALRGFVWKSRVYRRLGTWGVRRNANLVFSPLVLPPQIVDSFAASLRDYKPRTDDLPVLSDAELARLAAPVFYIAGAQDALLNTSASVARLQRFLPNLESLVLPEAGHVVIGAAQPVVRFLTSVERVSSPPGR